ncbi:MAG TPA: hypothetical protein PK092_08225 [Chitinophagaceae bacterium]|nr:hypothetical protein [Chitinophagaceae bacterium]
MTRLYLFLLLFLPAISFGQRYMNFTKSALKDSLAAKNEKKKGVTTSLKDTKDDLIYTIKGPGTDQTDIIYSFDSLGRCLREKVIAGCDTCIHSKLQSILNIQSYKWKKINENQYVSRFEDRLMIELSVNKQEHSFYIHRMEWTQLLYDILLGK